MRAHGRISLITRASVLAAGPVLAQDTRSVGAQPVAAQTASGDIIVTAQKRAENVQSVPVTVALHAPEALTLPNLDDSRFTIHGLNDRRSLSLFGRNLTDSYNRSIAGYHVPRA